MTKDNQVLSKTRDYALDNIKCLLIFTVVFGHLLRRCAPFERFEILPLLLYQYIYSFHMPIFIFVLGYNITNPSKHVVPRWILPYLIFQSIYLAFNAFILHNDIAWQYTTPHWILWYLMACTFYQLLLPLYDTLNYRKQCISITITFVLAIMVGYNKSIGDEFSLSRFFVFQPYFLLGYYSRKNHILSKITKCSKPCVILKVISVAGILILIPFLFIAHLPCKFLLHRDSYEIHNAAWARVAMMLFAAIWILFFFITLKPRLNKSIPVLTKIGQHTLPIYLLHGFVVQTLHLYLPHALQSIWHITLIATCIVLLFGNAFCKKLVYYIGGCWIEKYISHIKHKHRPQ